MWQPSPCDLKVCSRAGPKLVQQGLACLELATLAVHARNMLPPSWRPIFFLGLLRDQAIAQWIEYADSGPASLTHYTLPLNFVAACGCTPESTHYPTAALSQMAYGSSADYGAHISIISYHRWLIFIPFF